METPLPKSTLFAIGLRFGLLGAIVQILGDFLLRIANLSFIVYGVLAFLLFLVAIIVGIVLAQRAFRAANGSLMSYGQGVLLGLVVAVVVSLLQNIFNFIYINYIDPDFLENMKQAMVDFMERNRVSDDQIAQSTARFEEMRQPIGKALWKGAVTGLISGIIAGGLTSAFTKRKPADFD